jgi:hypothetical protein
LKRARWSPLFLLFVACSVIAVAGWRFLQQYPLPFHDFYPLYYGGKAWLATGNAYDLAPIVPAQDQLFEVYQVGNGYPLPAMLLVLPLTFLPPQVAVTIWISLLVGGMLLALRLSDAPFWLLFYLPVIEGLRIEQYSMFILVVQIVALWAGRERKYWLLAWCCAIILTKPSHGGLFVLLLLFVNRRWREPIIAISVVWGASLLLDPNWIAEWLLNVRTYVAIGPQTYLWPLLVLVLPLLFWRDLLTATMLTQLCIIPQPDLYSASMLFLPFIHERRSYWLVLAGLGWPVIAFLYSKGLATSIAFVLPALIFSYLRSRSFVPQPERKAQHQQG